MLPKEKYRIDLISSYRVTARETEDALSDANTRWKATALFFGRRAVKQGEGPTEADARAWYEAHKDSFRTKEMRTLRYVFFPLTIARADSDAAKEIIDRAYDQLVKGETFNLTTLDYSDHEGETLATMFPREKLDKLTDSIVSQLKPGQYSAPFLAGYGWQIAQLDSIKKDSVAIRRIVVRVKMGSEAVAVVRDSVRSFIEKAPAEKFDTLAARFGLAVRATRPLVGDQKELPGLDVQSPGQIVEWAKSAKPGQVFDLPQRGGNGYYVFELKEVKPAGVPAFDSVKQAATYRMRQDRDRQSWLEGAKQALAAVRAGKSFEQYAQEDPTVELQTDSFNGITDCRGKKGPEFAGALSALNPGDKYGLVEVSWGAFIIRCDERTTVAALDASAYADQRREQVAQDLMQGLLKQPEVRDYRDALAY
jgi:parvulin-like peptidyl-prolyl isomerase